MFMFITYIIIIVMVMNRSATDNCQCEYFSQIVNNKFLV